MTWQGIPERVEPFRFAEQGLSLSGGISLRRMPRLAETLLESDDEVAVELHFGKDEQGRLRLKGRVDALLSMQCQRCLGEMQLPLQLDLKLLLAHSEAELERLGPGEDALVVDEEFISLPGLVEDELLLAMPMFPRHQESECQIEWQDDPPDENMAEDERENPFSVLADLKKDP